MFLIYFKYASLNEFEFKIDKYILDILCLSVCYIHLSICMLYTSVHLYVVYICPSVCYIHMSICMLYTSLLILMHIGSLFIAKIGNSSMKLLCIDNSDLK